MFGINFPMDLDVKIKAVLLGACFLIVSLHFKEFKPFHENVKRLGFNIFFPGFHVFRKGWQQRTRSTRNVVIAELATSA